MLLYVTRHGETEYNKERRYAGSTDIPLNGEGIFQAGELAQKLKDINFDVIITSPLKRAAQTAEIINRERNLTVTVMEAFAERCVGVYEGLTRDEAKKRYPELWMNRVTEQIDGAPDGGETLRDVDTRVSAALCGLREKYPDKKVLLVCHGFVSRALNRIIRGLTFEEMGSFLLKNCEIAVYENI